jgi:hydrogenase maturation protease
VSQTLVLGVGNILLQDEGVGVRVVEQLREGCVLPEEIQVLDGGTMGLDLLYYLEGVERLLVIDAVDAGQPPGTILRLTGDEIPALLGRKLSPHQIGLADLLSVAELRDLTPGQVILIGVQPASLETGLDLSPTVGAQLPAIIHMVLKEMKTWGYTIEHRDDSSALSTKPESLTS